MGQRQGPHYNRRTGSGLFGNLPPTSLLLILVDRRSSDLLGALDDAIWREFPDTLPGYAGADVDNSECRETCLVARFARASCVGTQRYFVSTAGAHGKAYQSALG